MLGLVVLLLSASSAALWDPIQAMREFSRPVEFDFTEWTAQALLQKALSAALRAEKFLSPVQQKALIKNYLAQVNTTIEWNARLDQVVAQPGLTDRLKEISKTRRQLTIAKERLAALSFLTEAVVQSQTESILADLGFSVGGQVLPPVLYRVTDLPLNLIVSPRNKSHCRTGYAAKGDD